MSSSLERERKLAAPAHFTLAGQDLSDERYTVAAPVQRRLHTVYWDSPDLRLLRWGVSLRFRAGEGWTVKLPDADSKLGTFRTEHTFPGDSHAVPAAALDLVAAMLRVVRPVPIAELRTIRTERTVSGDTSELADIVEDDVRVVRSGKVVMRFRQIEIELHSDSPECVLEEIGRALRRSGAGSEPAPPKVAVAVGRPGPDPELVVPDVCRNSRSADVVRAALATSVRRLVRIDPALRIEPTAERVHAARVSVRRLRSHLRSFRPIMHRVWADRMRDRLRWLNDVLSGARDADVLIAGLNKRAALLPPGDRREFEALVQPFRQRRTEAYDALAGALRSLQYLNLIDALIAAARAPQFMADAYERADRHLDRLMRPAWRQLRKRVRRAGDAPHDRELHAIRIKAKQVRYAAEALKPVAGRAARTFTKRVEDLQTLLGHQHDAVVAYGALHAKLDTPELGFLAGEIAATERAVAQNGRSRWRSCWKRLDKKSVRFW